MKIVKQRLKNIHKLGAVAKENKKFSDCPKCRIKAFRAISEIPNTTKGNEPVKVWYCKHCNHSEIDN